MYAKVCSTVRGEPAKAGKERYQENSENSENEKLKNSDLPWQVGTLERINDGACRIPLHFAAEGLIELTGTDRRIKVE